MPHNDKTLEVYFDFSSPYGYLATLFADQLAHDIGRQLIWRPYLMGAAMKLTGMPPLVDVPIKRDYVWLDLARHAKRWGVTLKTPKGFPFTSVAVCRAFYALEANDPSGKTAAAWCKAAASAAWTQGQNLAEPSVLAEIAAELSLDPAALAEQMQRQATKDRLRAITDQAIAQGLWGSPHFIVDGQDSYWGCDKRLEILETYAS